ncbi:CPBP family intramembrane metalloprotease domain-containing protein [Chryseobacterium sp. T16E-39]|uniref:CPBP family intramembrane glutamic endopeptidase n=1 Tax=Chryseobacterium sp. T16E-39 TaxID=2015076 RepID=UPI000B5B228F|nr:type II CAAX endopeptidase family protein [Chryseobacterium sp. T16E-39]ASK30018.1 CPBP family intramembrane metalloprotease domain-containing protein [Chryseobacterium sp. T16E-39]
MENTLISKPEIRKNIATYLGLTLLFCLPVYYMCIHTGKLGGGVISYATIVMWCPAIAALLTCRLRGIPISSLGWKWGLTKYQLLAYSIPLLYSLLPYIVIWISGVGGFYNHEFITEVGKGMGWDLSDGATLVLYILLMSSFGMVRSVGSALGEEIGWRGLLTPQLAKINSYTGTSLWMGLIWSFYHYPLLLFSNYNTGGPKWLALTCFTVMIFASCFIFTWLRLKSGSLWTGAIMHASHNLFIQSILTPLTVDKGNTNYYIDEFGIALPIATVIVAYFFWRRRKELPEQKMDDSGRAVVE